MNYKILAVILILISTLGTGCIGEPAYGLKTDVEYPILGTNFGSVRYIYVTYLDNNTIKELPIDLSSGSWRGVKSAGIIVLDNRSYLKVVWIDSSTFNADFTKGYSYSEVHLTQEDLKRYIEKR